MHSLSPLVTVYSARRTMILVGRVTLCALAFCLTCAVARGDEEDDEMYRPGLIGRYADGEERVVDRVDRAVNFSWSDRSPDRRLAPGKLRVQWRGFLMSQAKGSYQFHAYFAGRLRVTLGGRLLLDAASPQLAWHSSQPVELPFDFHVLEVEYERSEEPGRVALYWSGPQFQLEPIEGRHFFHDRGKTPAGAWERGEQLVRALRCAACHELPGEPRAMPAPALDRLAGSIHRGWLADWLGQPATARIADGDEPIRRMPHFRMLDDEARAIEAYLFAQSRPAVAIRTPEVRPPAKKDSRTRKKKADEPETPPRTPVEIGQDLVFTVGCLACHRVGELGAQNLFGGPNLSDIAAKRPADFHERWLAEPASTNVHHRMPVFDLSVQERRNIAVYLARLGNSPPQRGARGNDAEDGELTAQGARLFARHRCSACHLGPEAAPAGEVTPRSRLSAESNWDRACSGSPVDAGAIPAGADAVARLQPNYGLSESSQRAVREFVSGLATGSSTSASFAVWMGELNCLACHARDESPGLAAQLTRVAQRHPHLAPLVPAMTPPPLASVGDKLHDAALRDAIRRAGPPHRPYLLVRMPKFALSDAELDSLVDGFKSADRIPPNAPRPATGTVAASPLAADRAGLRQGSPLLLDAVGSRLVTSDGFGCTSCHQVGNVLPAKAPLNARGPDLSLLGGRIRREWYDRWVRNPSRIVPRMEMPSVQVAVRGVLRDDVDAQLAAVWEVLNRPGFQPPQPDPVRTMRHTGLRADSPAHVVTDVLRTGHGIYIKPLLVGLSNRHNVLFDLESGRLAAWSVGDVAWQRTEGKTWFWEAAGRDLFIHGSDRPELTLQVDGKEQLPQRVGQFVTEFDVVERESNRLVVRHRLHFPGVQSAATRQLTVTQSFAPLTFDDAAGARQSGFRRVLDVTGAADAAVHWRMAAHDQLRLDSVSADGKLLRLRHPDEGNSVVRLVAPAEQRFQPDGSLLQAMAGAGAAVRWELDYLTDFPIDRFPAEPQPAPPLEPTPLHVVPGFSAIRLPFADDIMPTGLAWRPDGAMLITSLKGQVWLARDADGDGLAEQLQLFSDDLAAPYGVHASAEHVDVITKYALLRLFDDDRDGRADRTITAASGWGHTADYHDWAIGLPRDEQGNYFVAVPCQQDQRSTAAAHLRGEFLRLVPRAPTEEEPRPFAIEPVSRGHRFPMGIARHKNGALFVTDNQGNYNPFNELNHIRPGAHFGFINALEKSDGPRPPLSPPSINIPHPWTRSVNGICFLDTPLTAKERLGRESFGPWEGHLIGCEFDTRRLIRMSLQPVGETYQGAAYPFSYDQPTEGPPLLGPIVCDVSPEGDLFVGGLRDSGWGGANNIGEVVRLRLDAEQIPNGIAEVRAIANGFVVEFVKPILADRATDTDSYSLASYTRESTPAYGGPDVDRRSERITSISLSPDARQVTLLPRELRAGCVYELHVKNLVPAGEVFFPAEAHYTLATIPD